VITSTGRELQLAEMLVGPLAPASVIRPGTNPQPEHNNGAGYRGTLEEVEREYIVHILRQSDWRVEGEQGAASLLGLNPSTLRSRMRKWNIKRPANALH
jgi:transcriptional regulator with GAF, ATPase, and Fis domain